MITLHAIANRTRVRASLTNASYSGSVWSGYAYAAALSGNHHHAVSPYGAYYYPPGPESSSGWHPYSVAGGRALVAARSYHGWE